MGEGKFVAVGGGGEGEGWAERGVGGAGEWGDAMASAGDGKVKVGIENASWVRL